MTNPTDSFFGGGLQMKWTITNPDGTWDPDMTKFNVIRGGRSVGDPKVQNQTEMGTGKLRTWDNGDPKQQLVVPLLCNGSGQPKGPDGNLLPVLDERLSPTDDGRRNLYVNGKDTKNATR